MALIELNTAKAACMQNVMSSSMNYPSLLRKVAIGKRVRDAIKVAQKMIEMIPVAR